MTGEATSASRERGVRGDANEGAVPRIGVCSRNPPSAIWRVLVGAAGWREAKGMNTWLQPVIFVGTVTVTGALFWLGFFGAEKLNRRRVWRRRLRDEFRSAREQELRMHRLLYDLIRAEVAVGRDPSTSSACQRAAWDLERLAYENDLFGVWKRRRKRPYQLGFGGPDPVREER
jgi:hypothetical protein